jgi:hypothetical protein
VPGLRQADQAFPVSSAEFTGQPLELIGAGLVSLEDGRLALRPVLDGMLRVVVNVPDLAIASFNECLFAMDEVRTDGRCWVRQLFQPAQATCSLMNSGSFLTERAGNRSSN